MQSFLRNVAATTALSAAFFLSADCHGQSSQQDYLRQQAAALKAQMIRAQVEQAADPGFAAQAYAAQQAYLQDTAEKSFRVEKPNTTGNARFIGRSTGQIAAPATPPVHVAPSQFSAAPRPRRRPRNMGSDRSATFAPRPAARVVDLPTPEQIGYEGRSYAGPSNSVALQDRIAGLLSKPKYNLGQSQKRLPSPKFQPTTAPQQQIANTNPPAKTRLDSVQPNQPFFVPEHRTETTNQPKARPNQQAYLKMASAIQSREEDQSRTVRSTAKDVELESTSIAQVSLAEPLKSNPQEFFGPPPKTTPTTNRLPTFAPRSVQQKRVPAKQISILNKPDPPIRQEADNGFDGLPAPTEEAAQELPLRNQIDADDSTINSLRPNQDPTDGRRQEIEDLERKLRELEQQQPDTDTRRRQQELEMEEAEAESDRNRMDLEGELRSEEDPDEDVSERPARKSCQEFRNDLLNRSIRDISLDMSPRASRVRDQYIAISRSWTDRLGNIVATGSMVDLRRGYVIIDGINGRVKVPFAKLSDADWAAVADYWQIPATCSVGDNRLPNRHWIPQTFTWTASALCHKPLYFENRQLERYGHTHGPVLQPIHSAAHFFVSLATLPYATAIHPPTECRYALGYYRPGNCAPWLKDPLPISLDGLRRQAFVTTGLGLLP